MSFTPAYRAAAWMVALPLVLSAPLVAQDRNGNDPATILSKETYVRPPAEIERLVTAPRYLNVALTNQSPSRRYFVKQQSDGMPSIQQLGKPWYNLAGFQIDGRANRARVLTTRSGSGLEIIDATTGKSTTIEVPAGARVSGARWSPDGMQLAFMANFDDATHVYVADVSSGKSRRVTTTPVLATHVTEPEWAGNGQVVVVLIPDARGAEPRPTPIATGPKVRMTRPGAHNRTRTYADLLEWPYERDLLKYYSTGQLATVDVRTRAVRKIGAPTMIERVDASPTGAFFHVTLMQEPFSYTVQVSSFGTVDQIWDGSGKSVADLSRRALREADMNDDDADPGTRTQNDTARRNIEWLPGSADALYFLQSDATPAGAAPTDDAAQGQRGGSRAHDKLYLWTAPFDAANRRVLIDNANRMSEVAFSTDGKTVFVAENPTGVAHVFAVDVSDPAKRYTITRVRGLQATLGMTRGFGGGNARGGRGADSLTFYQNPGTLVSERSGETPSILTSSDGKFAYLAGVQYYRTFNDSAPQPFLDRIEIRTGEKSRLFTSARDQFEQVTSALDPDFSSAIVTRESATTVPDAYRRDLRSGTVTKLTNNRDYTPEITTAQRQMFQVTRPDGYKFWVTATMPADWKPGNKLPSFIWFYPYEYTDQAGYDRSKRTFNKNQFPNLNALSKVYLITQGYAVIEPDMPIVGEQNRMNDNYVSDLRNNMSAVIDELDRRGISDRQRMGIGGHSYGAFSTVNAMVHTPFFKAGIAGDGNYNRTLTPNTFQSERRDLWEARETYLAMSPLLYADRLTGALLMYHHLEDQNVGTDPINSIRLFHALQGMGKTAALYMYPYEDHGQIAKENILDQWARWVAWLDKYLKGAKGDGKIANE